MLKTVAVLSTLEGDLREEVLRLWKLLEAEYNSKGVQTFAHPSLSFQGGHCQEIAPLAEALSVFSRELASARSSLMARARSSLPPKPSFPA